MIERARQLFTVTTQSEGLSYVLNFKGEFFSEFGDEKDANEYADELSGQWADFARSELRRAAQEARERGHCTVDCVLCDTWRDVADWLERRAK